MRKIIFNLLAILAVPAFLYANQPTTLTLKIKGMSCESCEKKISEAILRIRGVESVDISHRTGEANVKLSENSRVSIQDVENVVKIVGFQIAE